VIDGWLVGLTVVAALGCGLMGGVFLAFSPDVGPHTIVMSVVSPAKYRLAGQELPGR
jgi:uncharacterized membrane protein